MASGKGNTHADNVLKWSLRNTTDAPTSPVEANIAISFTKTTNPSASSIATPLQTGGGYVAGGKAVTFGAVSSQTSTGHSGALQWPNTSGVDWVITGAIVHDKNPLAAPAEADMIYFDDTFDVTVSDGTTLEIATNGITITEA